MILKTAFCVISITIGFCASVAHSKSLAGSYLAGSNAAMRGDYVAASKYFAETLLLDPQNQYIKYKDDVFIVNGLFSETASYVPIEFIDKRPIAPYEMIQGFNFSRLEQWQKNQLKLVEKNGRWSTKGINVSTTQEDIVEWLSVSWDGLQALSVESFKMDSRLGYKSFDVIVNDNKKVTFYKIQESPQLHLYRKDEGLMYRFPGDLGFTMLNPHVKVKEKE